ncbi:hypothetical protein C8Q77DRAFT_913004 [Trametes polyzona]|nr:hypothetical protein C8Q77DRAFT_913004 [Trametes polyzona]
MADRQAVVGRTRGWDLARKAGSKGRSHGGRGGEAAATREHMSSGAETWSLMAECYVIVRYAVVGTDRAQRAGEKRWAGPSRTRACTGREFWSPKGHVSEEWLARRKSVTGVSTQMSTISDVVCGPRSPDIARSIPVGIKDAVVGTYLGDGHNVEAHGSDRRLQSLPLLEAIARQVTMVTLWMSCIMPCETSGRAGPPRVTASSLASSPVAMTHFSWYLGKRRGYYTDQVDGSR